MVSSDVEFDLIWPQPCELPGKRYSDDSIEIGTDVNIRCPAENVNMVRPNAIAPHILYLNSIYEDSKHTKDTHSRGTLLN